MSDEFDKVLSFWFGPDPDNAKATADSQSSLWWGGAENDALIRERFGALREQAINGELRDWESSPRGRLALIILIDQFSRNVHRGKPQAFEHDNLARHWCLQGLEQGVDQKLRPIERVFFYLPLEHCESLEHQECCVELYARLRDAAATAEDRKLFESYLGYGAAHHEIIRRFGRFPHRNKTLGRASTPEEIEFLKQPGSSF